jgi:hypothetical protein
MDEVFKRDRGGATLAYGLNEAFPLLRMSLVLPKRTLLSPTAAFEQFEAPKVIEHCAALAPVDFKPFLGN